jgi:hypothetical protein
VMGCSSLLYPFGQGLEIGLTGWICAPKKEASGKKKTSCRLPCVTKELRFYKSFTTFKPIVIP